MDACLNIPVCLSDFSNSQELFFAKAEPVSLISSVCPKQRIRKGWIDVEARIRPGLA
ncbi:MAG: hypothetical protein U0T82_09125 [Bacteroidales bacterium]